MPARFQLLARTGYPDFLDLPWDEPLEEWRSERFVEVSRGISRHVVRFVAYDDALFALKELPERYASREYRLLRRLAEDEMPVVAPVGVVHRERLDPILITKHLEYSLPFRTLFTQTPRGQLRDKLLSAQAELLVRLHLAGFFWGDCSLSNTLFRRDAGGLAAYLVDAETGELHPTLTTGQRTHDIELAVENVAGELLDVEAATEIPLAFDPFETAELLGERYASLWQEVTREEEFGQDERWRLHERLRRLNELGFDVEEIEVVAGPDGFRLKLEPRVVEPGHHRRRLHSRTGLDAQENQARRMLNDIAAYRVHLERTEGRAPPESVVAHRWVNEVFEPTIAAIPRELFSRRHPAEVFHEILEHRWYLTEKAGGKDVGLDRAIASYVETVLPRHPEERVVPRDGFT
jgi:Domain of unknown function (DUF4032)/Lipopolysaccharide kinase (Kdo/WaaP) family